MTLSSDSVHPFIKDTPSPWLYTLFSRYVNWLFKRYHHQVWIKGIENIKPDESYLFLLNHYSWWDGILPMLLHSQLFPFLSPKGIMDENQLKKLMFFRKFYVFSINRNEPRKAIASLKYASEHLSKKGTCLFIYPQGAIYPNDVSFLNLEAGYQRILKSCSSPVHIIPVVSFSETMYQKKATLWIHFCDKVNSENTLEDTQKIMQFYLQNLKKDAHQKNTESYTSIFI
jgi:1-acyl-sn-glycerol-3-phosphate acyltransferase